MPQTLTFPLYLFKPLLFLSLLFWFNKNHNWHYQSLTLQSFFVLLTKSIVFNKPCVVVFLFFLCQKIYLVDQLCVRATKLLLQEGQTRYFFFIFLTFFVIFLFYHFYLIKCIYLVLNIANKTAKNKKLKLYNLY